MIGSYAKLNNKGMQSIGDLIEAPEAQKRFSKPTLIQDIFEATDEEQDRIRIQGLWFNTDEVFVMSQKDYPELYL